MHLIVTPEYLHRVLSGAPELVVYALRLDRGLSSARARAAEPGTYWEEERGLDDSHYIVPGAGGVGGNPQQCLGFRPRPMSAERTIEPSPPRFLARWDLDKTYLRTEFDTFADLLRTAIERPDQKRTVPGAGPLLRELARAGGETHILSGSPEQMRSRIQQKLNLDGARVASLTLKPNLENLFRLRFRALRGQIGYKIPALLRKRCELATPRGEDGSLVPEVMLGDDAEADGFVYSLYADVCSGAVGSELLCDVLRRGGAYEDTIRAAGLFAERIEKGPIVKRILIHLHQHSSPSAFRVFGPRVVPFYNYLQAAFVLYEDGMIPPRAVLRVAQDLAFSHNFDGGALARSYLDLARRGHVSGLGISELAVAYNDTARGFGPTATELGNLVNELDRIIRHEVRARSPQANHTLDYLALAPAQNDKSRRD